uniref:Reverse transcriptase domain-containing protein n=1 Tax=Amphimedon queenslandica TaxID=400682 RepID=A0A1X7UVN4_AMPQE
MNTHKGLYRWTRLPYGVASSPAIFQGIMDKILQGLHQVVWYLDDILITGETKEQQLPNIAEVLTRLKKYRLKARVNKCCFFEESVEYLGPLIHEEGIHPVERRVTAILEAEPPQNVEQLQSFLGMCSYIMTLNCP